MKGSLENTDQSYSPRLIDRHLCKSYHLFAFIPSKLLLIHPSITPLISLFFLFLLFKNRPREKQREKEREKKKKKKTTKRKRQKRKQAITITTSPPPKRERKEVRKMEIIKWSDNYSIYLSIFGLFVYLFGWFIYLFIDLFISLSLLWRLWFAMERTNTHILCSGFSSNPWSPKDCCFWYGSSLYNTTYSIAHYLHLLSLSLSREYGGVVG